MHPCCCRVVCSTPIEYKYIIRAGDGEVKAVVQWQPCNNLELQVCVYRVSWVASGPPLDNIHLSPPPRDGHIIYHPLLSGLPGQNTWCDSSAAL
jgi:hypothetical protein